MVTTREEQRRRLVFGVHDQGSTVAGVTEGPRSRALDFDLIVEPHLAYVVLDHHVIELDRSHPSMTHTCCASDPGDDVLHVEITRDHTRECTDSLELVYFRVDTGVQLGDRAINKVGRGWVKGDELRELRDAVGSGITVVKRSWLKDRPPLLVLILIGKDMVVRENVEGFRAAALS